MSDPVPISYRPPKGQGWGHRVGRLSPLELLERSERFLHDCAVIVRDPPLGLTLIWEPSASAAMTAAVDASPLSAWGEGEQDEGPFFGGMFLRRVSRKLPAELLRPAVECLEELDPLLHGRFGFPHGALHRFVSFRWRDSPIHGRASLPLPDSVLGFNFGRPRHISTDLHFESIEHYRDVKRILRDLGLVDLSDQHVRPKRAIGEAPIDAI